MNTCTKIAPLILLGYLACQVCLAGDPPPPEPYGAETMPAIEPAFTDAPFAEVLRQLVHKNLPHDMVFEKNDNWGHQAHVPTLHGLKIVEVMRNHGNWYKLQAVVQNVPNALRVEVQDLRYGPDQVSYTVRAYLLTAVHYEHRLWQNGILLQGGHGLAHVRFKTTIGLQAKIQFDGKGDVRADQITDLRTASANTVCEYFTADQVNNLTGELAKLLDGKIERAFNDWKPALERDVQAKVRQAVLLAAQTPRASAATAFVVNAVAAKAREAAMHPPVPAGSGAAPEPVVVAPVVVQGNACFAPALAAFIELQLNGHSPHAPPSPPIHPAATPPRWLHGDSGFHFEPSIGSFGSFGSSGHSEGGGSSSHESHESHESHADHGRDR